MSEPIKYRQLIEVEDILVDVLDDGQVMVTCVCLGEHDFSFHMSREKAETLRQDIAAAFLDESVISDRS